MNDRLPSTARFLRRMSHVKQIMVVTFENYFWFHPQKTRAKTSNLTLFCVPNFLVQRIVWWIFSLFSRHSKSFKDSQKKKKKTRIHLLVVVVLCCRTFWRFERNVFQWLNFNTQKLDYTMITTVTINVNSRNHMTKIQHLCNTLYELWQNCTVRCALSLKSTFVDP